MSCRAAAAAACCGASSAGSPSVRLPLTLTLLRRGLTHRRPGLPPIINFGSKYLQDKCVKDCLQARVPRSRNNAVPAFVVVADQRTCLRCCQGKKFICLAITEPLAGSDVASLRTTAVKDASGKFYVVNGEKKWCVRLGRLACSCACAQPC